MAYWWIRPGNRADFDASHPWGMPGIACSSCGNTWARTGPALPCISFEGEPLGERLNRWPLPLVKWKELAQAVRPRVPESEPIVPGLAFGPLRGKLYRPFRLGWHGDWGLVASSSLQRELAEVAPGVALVAADLGVREEYFELELRSDAVAANLTATSTCPECGYSERRMEGDRLVIRDVRLDLPLFRLLNHPAALIAEEALLPLLHRELGDQVDCVEAHLVA